uniref:Uncharacterized protein n=1 Tax=Meloidogyne hapla TaxID=6305 RepID=A0A1I8BJM8_MELHA
MLLFSCTPSIVHQPPNYLINYLIVLPLTPRLRFIGGIKENKLVGTDWSIRPQPPLFGQLSPFDTKTINCYANPSTYADNLEGVTIDWDVGLQKVKCNKVTANTGNCMLAYGCSNFINGKNNTYYNCLSYDFVLNVHKRPPTQFIPIIITEKNFCKMMKKEFICEECCICYNNDCNKDFKKCKNQGKKAQNLFKIYKDQKPNDTPILKIKYPITTTTTTMTTTIKTTLKTTKKTTLSTKTIEKSK